MLESFGELRWFRQEIAANLDLFSRAQHDVRQGRHSAVNGERVDLAHFGPEHTAGDAAVFFRGHNAVHLGGVLIGSRPRSLLPEP
jgi:hypothetical protein